MVKRTKERNGKIPQLWVFFFFFFFKGNYELVIPLFFFFFFLFFRKIVIILFMRIDLMKNDASNNLYNFTFKKN
jgi:hypothetical protein